MESQHARSGEADDDAMTSAVSTLDAQLLAEDARAVPVSMDAFLAQVERRAFRMAEMNLGHREDALDAVQDAMLRLVKHYSDKPAQEWTPLFWGILRRRIVDLQRRRKVRSIVVGWLGGGHDESGNRFSANSLASRGRGRTGPS